MTNKALCQKCQLWPVLYRVSSTGKKLKHGVCRECYEVGAGSGRTSKSGGGSNFRTRESQENTHETKFGTGHG
jgi:hypothetical protein